MIKVRGIMKSQVRLFIPLAVIVVGAATGLIFARTDSRTVKEESLVSLTRGPREIIDIGQDAFKGSPTAKVIMIEYSDFQCPFCIEFAKNILPDIESRYVDTGKVRVAFRNFPLVSLHPYAQAAAVLAECARTQGRLWPVHDLLFSRDGKLNKEALIKVREEAGLLVDATESCVQGDAISRVEQQVRDGSAMGIDSTPTVILGLEQAGDKARVVYTLAGVRSRGTLRKALDDLVLEAGVPAEARRN